MKETIQIPIELKNLESEIIETLGPDIEIEISDLHHQPIGAPGIGLFWGFIINLLVGEAVVGFMKGLGIDLEASSESAGKEIKKVPVKVKKLFKWQESSREVFGNKPSGYLKIFISIGETRICFYFGKIDDIKDFYFALANIQESYIQLSNILSGKFIKRKEIIILIWEEGRWKINSLLSSFL